MWDELFSPSEKRADYLARPETGQAHTLSYIKLALTGDKTLSPTQFRARITPGWVLVLRPVVVEKWEIPTFLHIRPCEVISEKVHNPKTVPNKRCFAV